MWWDRLLVNEPRLDMSKIDVTKHISELPDEDKMNVEKVLVRDERKEKEHQVSISSKTSELS